MLKYTKLEGAALQAINVSFKEFLKRSIEGSKDLGVNESNFAEKMIIRELRFEDLGGSNGNFTFNLSTSGNNTNIVNTTLGTQRYALIYGIAVPQPAAQVTTALTIRANQKTKRIWNIQGASLTEDSRFYFSDPFMIGQGKAIQIDAFTSTTNPAERIVFLGIIIEPRGRLTDDDGGL